jgi:hypothetical protein
MFVCYSIRVYLFMYVCMYVCMPCIPEFFNSCINACVCLCVGMIICMHARVSWFEAGFNRYVCQRLCHLRAQVAPALTPFRSKWHFDVAASAVEWMLSVKVRYVRLRARAGIMMPFARTHWYAITVFSEMSLLA